MSEPSGQTTSLDYRNPMHLAPRQRAPLWRRALVWSFVGVGGLVLLMLLLLPTFGRARESANRVKCASNLRQIAQGAMLYANEHYGQLPPDLLTLYLDADLYPDVFICPSHGVERATGATPQQITSAMLAGDHLGYAWVGAGLHSTDPGTADVVIAFDLEHHQPKDGAVGTGINVLLLDGTVTFVNEATGKSIWAQFVAGVRPIRLPSPTTVASASGPSSP